ncbi:MAG: TonB-dependent receptor, partial [Azonexus sp.]|jgi:outer membrane receptor protein involved in Fe transport|nr:TonB-dependent receptor [Azonexus sp.]
MRLSVAGGVAVGASGHLVFGMEGYKSAEITDISGRDWYKGWGDLDFGANSTPRRVRYENVITRAESFGGLIRFGPLAGIQFLDDGTAAPFQAGSVLDLSAQTGLNNRTPANPRGVIQGSQVGGSGDLFARYSMQQAALERASLYLNYKHEFSERLSGSLQGIFGYSYADNQKVGYQMSGTWPITLYSGNPYLPADLQAQMTQNGIASFQVHKRVAPFDPLHNGRAPLTTDMSSLTASLEGALANGWNWNAYYQFGESNRDVEMYGYRVDRMFKGIDVVVDPATGAITCASTLIEPNDGCVPVNILGVGNVSRQALEWLHDKMFTDARIKQHTAEFVLDGEVFSGFGDAGPVFMAVGAGWRQDSINQVSGDPINTPLPPPEEPGPVSSFNADGVLLYRGLPSVYENSSPVIDRIGAASFQGSVNVSEIFTEASIPLLAGKPLIESLNSSVAARYTDYEVSGQVVSWKAGFDWQLNDELRFRWTRSRDIRAGNLSEMFDTTNLYAFMNDPFRPEDEVYVVKQISGGNPAVEPEDASTLTYGLVYQPQWLQGLGMTLDYYDIRIASAISTIGAQNIVDYCFEEGLFCDQITYESSGRISAVNNTTLNVGEARTSGVDFEVSYRVPVDLFGRDDSLALRLLSSHLLEASVTPFRSPKTRQDGVGDRQKTHLNFTATYSAGPATLSWSTRWVSAAKRNRNWVTGIDVDNNRIPSHHLSNLRLSWNLDSLSEGSSVYLAITNLFDKNPGDLNGLNGIYDILGRNYSIGLRYRL